MKTKKFSIVIIVLAVIVAITALVVINKHYKTRTANIMASIQPLPSSPIPTTGALPIQASGTKSSLLLSVPFTPQAPTGNWDTIHNADCEEASALMANAYYNGPHDAKLDPSYVEGQLTMLTNWETQNFGYDLDITSEETVKMIAANYGLQTKILYNYTEDDIKNELNQNHLVLIPENGQMLDNPNYKSPGPIYHMLVIRGYTPTSIITNDSGTRNGLNYSYSFNTLYNANGDFDHSTDSVNLTDKNIIVVWK